MSGLEVAGLVLGAFSAVHQLTGNSKDNAGIFGRTKEVQKANLEIRQKLFLQSKSFHRGFRRLFSGIIDESEMDALLKDPQSGIWDDEGLDADFRQHFSDEYESARIALNRVHKALMEIEQTLQKLSKTGREELYLTEVHSNGRGSGNNKDILSKDRISLTTKRQIAIKDPIVKKQFKALKECNVDFREVVDRITGPVPSQTITPSRSSRSKATLSSIRRMQTVSRRLYDVLRNSPGFPCNCHGYNLALEFDDQQATEKPFQRCFRLLAVMNASKAPKFEMQMNIDGLSPLSAARGGGGPQLVEIRARKFALPKQPKTKPSHQQTKGPSNSAIAETVHLTTTHEAHRKHHRKRPRPAVQTVVPRAIRDLKIQFRRPNGNEKSEELEPDGFTDSPVHHDQIDNLCSCLSKVNNSVKDESNQHEECIGYLPDNYNGTHTQYLFYTLEWPLPDIQAPSQTLLDKLRSGSSINKLGVPARLELAFVMAVSLLQYQASPWLNKRFRSSDFGLYSGPSEASTLRLLPYIAVTFDSINQGYQSRARRKQHESEETRVFSLGVILIEIGRWEPLCASEVENNEEEEEKEALRHIRRKTIASIMGSAYQAVVNTCVMWDAKDSLEDEKAQIKFYEEVVCMLDKALYGLGVNQVSKLGIKWD